MATPRPDYRALMRAEAKLTAAQIAELAGPELISAARSWAADCQWAEDADDIADLSDTDIVRGVQRHYAGGWAQFTRDRG